MQRQFVVPQFIDVEDKILGPITTRQFSLILVAVLLMFIAYQLAQFWLFLIEAIVVAIIFGVIAFVRINGMPFHFFLLNLVQTGKRAKLRVWDKTLSDSDLRAFVTKEKVQKESAPTIVVKNVSTNRLSKLSLVVNTGGVYQDEETISRPKTNNPVEKNRDNS